MKEVIVVEVISIISNIYMRGMFKEHIITASLADKVVQCATCIDYKELVTHFVLWHAILAHENAFSALQNNVQLLCKVRNDSN
jgi:hypothetical protein